MPSEVVTVGINGFGPVGRNVFYAVLQDPKLSIVAVNDPSFTSACMAYMMEHERPAHLPAIHVEADGDKAVIVNGTHRVSVTQESRPTKWGELGVQVVLECTGTSTTKERCATHITFGAQHVIIANHSADAPLVVRGVTPAEKMASNGSSVQVHSCGGRLGAVLAPFLRLVDSSLVLEEVSYTAISGLSDEADPAAGRSADPMDWRQLRLQQSTATGKGAFAPSAAHTGERTLLKLFPQLQGRITASAFQVPGHKGCAVDLFLRTGKAACKEEFDRLVAAAAAEGTEPFVKMVGGSESGTTGAMISTDCLGSDTLLYETAVSTCASQGHSHKVLLWLDLEWAYAKQVVTLVHELTSFRCAQSNKSTMTEAT